MTQLYLPLIGDLIRLTEPLELDPAELNLNYGSDNMPTLFRINHPEEEFSYQWRSKLTKAVLEAGTVLAFRRYFVSVHAKTNDVQVSIFASPRRDLTPKKNGGTGLMAKLTLPLAVLNRIEYEKVIP